YLLHHPVNRHEIFLFILSVRTQHSVLRTFSTVLKQLNDRFSASQRVSLSEKTTALADRLIS
ncbi:MAG: hypothetical protein AAFV98_09925, partial [Chloroflexota bacterium]